MKQSELTVKYIFIGHGIDIEYTKLICIEIPNVEKTLACHVHRSREASLDLELLTPKFDTATWPFLKIDMRHGA